MTADGVAQQRRAQPEPRPVMVRSEQAYPTGDRATSVILLERLTPPEVRAGTELEYQIRLTNLTRVDLRDVVLVEQFPPNFAPQASDPKTQLTATRSASWKWPQMRAGTTETIRVRGATTTAAELNFCATVTFAAVVCASTRVVDPQLVLTKSLSPEVVVCEPIVMGLTVSNTGSGVLRGVRISDNLPAGLTTVDGRSGVAIDVGDLPAGQSRTYTMDLRAAYAGEFTNTALAEEEGGLRTESSARSVVRQPVLALSKRGPTLRYLGRPATFEITVQNPGDVPARNVVLTDVLASGAELLNAEGAQVAGNRVRWQLGTLEPKAARTVALTLRSNQVGLLENTATVEAYCVRAAATAGLEVVGIPAILLEVVDDPDPIEVGDAVTYTIEVTNQGSAVGTNIVIACTLPGELQYMSAAGQVPFQVEGQSIRFAPLASLAPKAKAIYRVVATGTQEADARIRVTLTSDQTTSAVEETESTHVY